MKLFKKKQQQHKHPDLKLAFEYDGHEYFTFEIEKRLPFERLVRSMNLMDLMSASVSGVELDKALDLIDDAIFKGINTPKNAAAVAAIVHLLRERRRGIMHRDLLLNMAAVWTVRDDEPVAKVDDKILREKIDLFEKLSEQESHSFFLSLSIERLSHYSAMEPATFNELWMNSAAQVRLFNAQLNSIEDRLAQSLVREKKQ